MKQFITIEAIWVDDDTYYFSYFTGKQNWGKNCYNIKPVEEPGQVNQPADFYYMIINFRKVRIMVTYNEFHTGWKTNSFYQLVEVTTPAEEYNS